MAVGALSLYVLAAAGGKGGGRGRTAANGRGAGLAPRSRPKSRRPPLPWRCAGPLHLGRAPPAVDSLSDGRAVCGSLGVRSGAAGARTAPSAAGRRHVVPRRRAIVSTEKSRRLSAPSFEAMCFRTRRRGEQRQLRATCRKGIGLSMGAPGSQHRGAGDRTRDACSSDEGERAPGSGSPSSRPDPCDLGNAERHGVPHGGRTTARLQSRTATLGEAAPGRSDLGSCRRSGGGGGGGQGASHECPAGARPDRSAPVASSSGGRARRHPRRPPPLSPPPSGDAGAL